MNQRCYLQLQRKLFDEIHVIEPHKGEEEFNDDNDYTWDFIKKEFKTNLRFFDNIIHHKNFSQIFLSILMTTIMILFILIRMTIVMKVSKGILNYIYQN